jgi:NTE family protein
MRATARRLSGALLALLAAAAPASPACTPSPVAADAPLALVLSGGGAKGAYDAGVATGVLDRLPIALVAGSSAGALSAAMIADGRLDRLESTWRGITRERVYRVRPSAVLAGLLPGWLTLLTLERARSLLDPAPLRALIAETIDLDRVRASPRQLVVVATDLAHRQLRVFDNSTVTVDTLMAAIAVPGVFPPVEVDGTLLVDGGLISRAPVGEVLERMPGLARVLVVAGDPPGATTDRPTRLKRALEESIETSMLHQIRRETELARLRYPAVDVQLLTPSVALSLRPLDFDPAGMARAFEQGRADALLCLQRSR